MSTRASILIKDQFETIYLYRHSDGYFEGGAGEDLVEFVKDYTSGAMRLSASQSAGWLIVRGHFEYKDAKPAGLNDYGVEVWPAEPSKVGPRADNKDRYDGWKVGACEPATGLHADVEYIYTIDLVKRTLSTRKPKAGFWDNPTLENTKASTKHKPVKF